MAAKKKKVLDTKFPAWDRGWNRVTVLRTELVGFLNELGNDPYNIPTSHIHMLPSDGGCVDVLFLYVGLR